MSDIATLSALLHTRATNDPDRTAFLFLDGTSTERRMSYGELDRRARAIAAELQSIAQPGERALLLYPPGLDYIAALFGCLYARIVAVPVYPPDPTQLKRTLPRLQAIANDAQASVCLTTDAIRAMTDAVSTMVPDLAGLTWLATSVLPAGREDTFLPSEADQDELAWLQYTSGSTGAPKGVMLTHRSLLHNSMQIEHAFGHTSQLIGVIWLPPYHDMGLIGGIIQPIYVGGYSVLLSPLSFLKRPLSWLSAISKYRATTSGGPNFAYDLAVRKTTPADRAALDLSCWEVAFNGAEPVRSETIDRFAEAFAVSGFRREAFYPCYGLAESALIVTGGAKLTGPHILSVAREALADGRVVEQAGGVELISSGRSLPDQHLVVVERGETMVVGEDRVGEILVASASVASGYWNNPEQSAEVFGAQIEGRPFLRTGDLGFVHDGDVFITGRTKELIIIRGRNHYPQDIEHSVESAVRWVRPGCCAAFSVDVDGEEQLVVVAEIDRRRVDPAEAGVVPLDRDTMTRAIRETIIEQHQVDPLEVLLVRASAIPKTSSGKLQRYACKTAYLARSLELII